MSIKITINGQKTIIPYISELSVKDFVQIVDKNINTDIISYINAFTGKDIMKSEVKSNYDLGEIEPLVLDADIDFSKLPVPNLLEVPGYGSKIIEELDDGTFGKRFMYSQYKSQMENKVISITQLPVYALALFITNSDDAGKINDCYEKLLEMPWIKVLPAGFFLSKKLTPKRNVIMKFLKELIINLNYIGKLIQLKLKRTKTHTICS